MQKIDYNKIKFIANDDSWYVKNTEVRLDIDCTQWKYEMLFEDGWGLFEGITTELYNGSNQEELYKLDGETCGFDEFDIFYNNIRINEFTFNDLILYIRKEKILRIKSIINKN
jgi:hypothetical protein